MSLVRFLETAFFAAILLSSSCARAVPLAATRNDALESSCNRTAMAEAADAYMAAQTEGKLDALAKVTAASWTYVENNKKGDAAKGILTKALPLDHRRTIYDMAACATYTEMISAKDAANPYVIGTQIRHQNASEGSNGTVVAVDSIVSTTNSWLFDAKKTLSYVQQENWTAIPDDQRDPRSAIQAAGDAYLDMWSNATAANAVPWGTPCTRLEGSAYTGRNRPDDSCQAGIPANHSQAPNTHRRYVIDEAMGSVSIFCVWAHMMNAADSHEFRLEKGKLRYVHTMTVCGGRPCRL